MPLQIKHTPEWCYSCAAMGRIHWIAEKSLQLQSETVYRMWNLLLCVGNEGQPNWKNHQAVVLKPYCVTLQNPRIAVVYKLETFFKCLLCGSAQHLVEIMWHLKILWQFHFSWNSGCSCLSKECSLTAAGDMITELLGNNDVTPTEESAPIILSNE